jgi:hypothetical protein
MTQRKQRLHCTVQKNGDQSEGFTQRDNSKMGRSVGQLQERGKRAPGALSGRHRGYNNNEQKKRERERSLILGNNETEKKTQTDFARINTGLELAAAGRLNVAALSFVEGDVSRRQLTVSSNRLKRRVLTD